MPNYPVDLNQPNSYQQELQSDSFKFSIHPQNIILYTGGCPATSPDPHLHEMDSVTFYPNLAFTSDQAYMLKYSHPPELLYDLSLSHYMYNQKTFKLKDERDRMREVYFGDENIGASSMPEMLFNFQGAHFRTS